jgi:hypothetical protein
MRSMFTRMNPKAENMVTEPGLPVRGNSTTAILCVECTWEGTAVTPDAPWVIFMGHQCRLITESVSTSD